MDNQIKDWEKRANDSFENFKTLENSARIGIIIDENVIILNKEESSISISLEKYLDLKEPFPQIGFRLNKQTSTQVLSNDYDLFRRLTIDDEIQIYSMASLEEINEMGYKEFLKDLGFTLKDPSTCTCPLSL